MFRNKTLIAFIVFLFFSAVFFNKTILKGQIPFPGDLLVGNYIPYSSYSILGYAPGGYPHKAQNIDVVEQLYPWKFLSINVLKKGEIPLWNPYNFSGTPHLASIQSGTFYPINVLFFLLPFVTAWTIYIILQPILAGFFTYLFLREIKIDYKGSIFGGLIFSFSSFLVVWMQYGNIIHAALWLPLVMWLGLKNLQSQSIIKSILLSFTLALSVFAGHFQVSIYLYGFSFLFLILTAFKFYRKNIISKLLMLFGVYSFSILVAGVQIIPSIEIFINSSRTNYTYDRLVEFLIPVYHLIGMLFPDFFGNPVSRNYYLTGTYIERVSYLGIIPFFFAIYAIFVKKNYYIWFFIVSAIGVFFITFDSFITKFLYSIYIPPIIATSVPTRIMFVFIFSLSVISAYGFSQFESIRKKLPLIKALLVMIFIVLSTWLFVYFYPSIYSGISVENLSIAKRNLLVPSAVLITALFSISIFYSRKEKLKINQKVFLNGLVILIFALTIFELYYFFQKFSPFSPAETIYPSNTAMEFIKEKQGLYRSWGYGAANMVANIHTYEKIYSTDGYDPFYIRRYGELTASTQNGKIPENIKRANAALSNGYGEQNLKDNKYRQKMMNLMGIKYVLHKKDIDNHAFDKTFDENIYKLVWFGNGLQIYENKNVLTRAFLVSDYEVIESDEEIINRLYENDFDISKTMILEKDPQANLTSGDGNGTVNITKYSENEVIISVISEKEALLFLSDNYFPEWNAYIDGNKTEVYRANYTFRAVFTPKGEHEIVFRYEPKSFELGKWISMQSILGGLLLITIVKFKARK